MPRRSEGRRIAIQEDEPQVMGASPTGGMSPHKRARDLQSERTLRGRKDDAIATLRVSEIAIWRQLISRRDTFSLSGPLT